jgi:hypothetical protein
VYTRVGENLPSPLAPKVGRSILLNATVATGSQRWQAIKTNCCFSEGLSRPGSGQKRVLTFGGSPTASGATPRHYGTWPVSIWRSAIVRVIALEKSGEKVWK